MLYHASPVGGIEVLQPNASNHNEPLLYFSDKRENVLVYLSNAVEKFCRETGFVHTGKWHKWASYGFDADGILQLDEYYPHALEDTYKGVSGYIYTVCPCEHRPMRQIPNAFVTDRAVAVDGVEYIEDAYEEIRKAEQAGLIKLRRYEDLDDGFLQWIEKTIRTEYKNAEDAPDYRHFLKAKFDFLQEDHTEKFNGRALQYTRGRPGYAPALLDFLFEKYGFCADATVADIGSGTGIFTKQLLERGCHVYAVEPNAQMREVAELALRSCRNFQSVAAAAEKTTLPAASVDFVTVAQAFHWFDGEKFRRECRRILRPDGAVFLIWNMRKEEAALNRRLQEVYSAFCPAFCGFHGGTKPHDERIRSFFSDAYECTVFENPLLCDRETFINRSLSSSFSLQEGEPAFEEYRKALFSLFDCFAQDGKVRVENQTVVYAGHI